MATDPRPTDRGVRLRRSVLFTPGTRGDRVQKALETRAADVVVADLEDAVPPEEKADARAAVHDALTDVDRSEGRPETCVRINAWRSRWAVADLEAVLPARPEVIVVPKAASHAELVALDLTLTRLERQNGLVPGATGVLPILETARGILVAEQVARAARVVGLAFGAEDLAADAGLRRSRESHEVLYARQRVALAAAAAGIDAIDQVFVDIDDPDHLAAEARTARSYGYRGKMVIHPKQVRPVHTAFTPSPDEVKAAKRLINAVDSAAVGEGGVLRFEGRMIDVPLIGQARRVLAEAEAARERD